MKKMTAVLSAQIFKPSFVFFARLNEEMKITYGMQSQLTQPPAKKKNQSKLGTK